MLTVLIIYGASGDLARRKLFPSLYTLYASSAVPNDFICIGFARRSWNRQDFIDYVRKSILSYSSHDNSESLDGIIWEQFSQKLYYVEGSFEENKGYVGLNNLLKSLQDNYRGNAHLIHYLSIPPNIFDKVINKISYHKLNNSSIVIEKPFGHDMESSKQLNMLLASVFNPEDVYTIDHYLGKYTVQNLLILRMNNNLLSSLYNNKYIDSIQITMSETLGIGTRAAFYESTGIIKDVFQNHILQIVSLLLLDVNNCNNIASAKNDILSSLDISYDIDKYCSVAQYTAGSINNLRVNGYLEEEGVNKKSKTPTAFAIKLLSNTLNWNGTPIYVRTGKRFSNTLTRVDIIFKPRIGNLNFNKNNEYQNILSIRLQPNPSIDFKLYMQTPNEFVLSPSIHNIDFSYVNKQSSNILDAYAVLFHNILHKDKSLFPDYNEIANEWKLTDKILQSINNKELDYYPAGTNGPVKFDDILRNDHRKWLSI